MERLFIHWQKIFSGALAGQKHIETHHHNAVVEVQRWIKHGYLVKKMLLWAKSYHTIGKGLPLSIGTQQCSIRGTSNKVFLIILQK